MNNTIKADNERKVIKQEYLNDNALLEVIEVDESIKICVRFIEENKIKEHTLIIMTKEKYNREGQFRIIVSEDNKKIALFCRAGDGYQLERLYDLEEHEFAVCDFMDIEYRNHFKKPVLNKCLIYKMEGENA